MCASEALQHDWIVGIGVLGLGLALRVRFRVMVRVRAKERVTCPKPKSNCSLHLTQFHHDLHACPNTATLTMTVT